jgi:SAM-dependent methyltransferase
VTTVLKAKRSVDLTMNAGPPGLLVCPGCRTALAWENALTCPRCGQTYLSDGVPCFNDRGAYFDSLPPRPAMATVMELSRTNGYRHALTQYLGKQFPRLVARTPLASPQRAEGLRLLGPFEGTRVLDFGCALGVLSVPLAKQAELVVALDATHEALEFLALVRSQDGLASLVPVCNGDPLRLPFPDDHFDCVVLNAVFEYLPEAIDEPSVWLAHRLALEETRRVLKPGGRIYLATKNRFSHQNLLGAQDHNGLRFTALLPRRLANALSVWKGKGPYRTVTYSFREYRRLLRAAGFRSAEFYWPFPDLWAPKHFVPLTGPRAGMLGELKAIEWPNRGKKVFWMAAALCGVLPALVPTYIILAEK